MLKKNNNRKKKIKYYRNMISILYSKKKKYNNPKLRALNRIQRIFEKLEDCWFQKSNGELQKILTG